MKLLNLSCSITLTLFLGACATTNYSEPTEPAPSLWQGSSGYKFAGQEWKVLPGNHSEESAFAITEMENIRTARLESPVTFEDVSRMGYTSKTKTLAAGTPLYARQYTQSVTTSYGGRPGYTRTQSAWRNPIEWCAEGDYSDEGIVSGWTCIFWQKPEVAYYTSSSKGHPQAPLIGSDGSVGPMPSISETKDVTFQTELKSALVLRQIRKKDATVSLVVGGKMNESWSGNVIRFQRKEWDENDTISLDMMGGKFLLKAIRSDKDTKPEEVNVEIIKSPTSGNSGLKMSEEQMKLIQMLLESAKQSSE